MEANLYPISPEDVSKKFTRLHGAYISKAILSILAIIFFAVLYCVLVAGFCYLTYFAIVYPMGSINKLTILLKIGAIGGSAMLVAFTLKFLFKIKNSKRNNRIKLSKEEHSNLWDFVYRICSETGAPKPKNIYVDPDVNAYVAYSNPWLSLFLPIKKELTIGLGLIDSLNLSEFKAVISHEFGHFAQKEMKIGSYINTANTIIHDMIYERDSWDNTLEQWRNSDIRLAAAAWVVTPVTWIVRQLLVLFYQLLNIMYAKLSREMEFNADKFAVKTSGSEAIVSALWKLEQGFETWNLTVNHSYLATKKKVFVENLYKHHQIAQKKEINSIQQLLGELAVDTNGNKIYFSSSETSKVGMYASHPPNDLREQNANTPYIECHIDQRSPWLLFHEEEKLQIAMTTLIYKEYLNHKPENYSTEEVFENFILQETQGKELQAEYQNTFKNRFLIIPEEQDIINASILITEVKADMFKQLKNRLNELMVPVQEIESLMLKAVEISNGTTTENSITFKDKSFKKKNIGDGYNFLQTERENLFNTTFIEWDKDFCAIHSYLAQKIGKRAELFKIYDQHKIISEIYKAILNTKTHIYSEFNKLQEQGNLDENIVRDFSNNIKKWVGDLNGVIKKIDTIDFVPMSNIDDTQEFKENIIDGGEFKKWIGNIFENGTFNEILNDLETATNHCQRLEQKNIGLILMFHNQLKEENKLSEIEVI